MVKLPRVSKGKRPHFYENEAIDQMFAIVTALGAEVSVAFDRIDTLERLLEQAQIVTRGAVEAYRPAEDVAAYRHARREALLQRMFAVFEAYGHTGKP